MRRLVFHLLTTFVTFSAIILCVFGIFFLSYHTHSLYFFDRILKKNLFAVQSIDTMKYSRDTSEKVLQNPDSFKPMVDTQMALIAETGATHVAIDTPYDAHFIPVLRLWVASARAHNLSIWFRGNFSGWEGWFGYSKIDRATHEQLLKEFLLNNPDLFRSGDIFTPCPECENGGPGDPRQTGDENGYNTFLLEEKEISRAMFALQVKNIAVYPSMNADIAQQSITPATVSAFGGSILIDHYAKTPEEFGAVFDTLPQKLNAHIGLGEFGAPIPDLNGEMTQTEQATYVDSLFNILFREQGNIPLVNYWSLSGGSTALVGADGVPRSVYFTVRNYFKAFTVYGFIYNALGEDVHGATVSIDTGNYSRIANGPYQIFVPRQYQRVTIQADGYVPITLTMPRDATTTVVHQDVYLQPIHPDWWYYLRANLYKNLTLNF